jgi:hypothetical protein
MRARVETAVAAMVSNEFRFYARAGAPDENPRHVSFRERSAAVDEEGNFRAAPSLSVDARPVFPRAIAMIPVPSLGPVASRPPRPRWLALRLTSA